MTAESSKSNPESVFKRKVFCVPGYDPISPRRYRELFRRESADQSRISGYDISLKARKTGHGNYGWDVQSKIDGQTAQTRFEYLVWSDIVKDSLHGSVLATFFLLFRTAWIYIASGALFRLMRLRKGPVIVALYPVIILLIQLNVSLAVGYFAFKFSTFLPLWASIALGAGCFVGFLHWFKSKDTTFFAYYLMHDYGYSARFNGAYPPALQARIKEFSEQIKYALEEDWDEVLVIGHSSGAHIAISALTECLLNHKSNKSLSFLSIGHVVPMVSFLKNADQLRADLNFLSSSKDVTWVDVTAPGDGCTFALCDPAGVTGVAPTDQTGPLVISAAFSDTISKERLKDLRFKFFHKHILYMCAFDKPRDYDYFKVTSGPLTLAKRFEKTKPSPSLLAKPVSKYRSMRGRE